MSDKTVKLLLKELEGRAEFWRENEDDPHQIGMAVYVAISSVADALTVAIKKKARQRKRRRRR
jgi:hypothetical protein